MALSFISTNTELALVSALNQSLTLCLPSNPPPGKSLFIKDATGNSFNSTITISTTNSYLYEDSSYIQTLNSAYESLQLGFNSNTWYVVGGSMLNTFRTSTLRAQNISTFNLSSGTVSVSSFQIIDSRTSTLGTFNTVSSFLYYNGYNIGGGLRTAIPQTLNTYTPAFIFNPNSISNLSFWFDASVSTSMAVSTNSTILYWNSLSTTNTYPKNITNTLTVSTQIGVLSNTAFYAPNTLNGFGGINLSTSRLGTNNLGISNAPLIYYNNILDSEFTTICLVNRLFTGTPNANNASIYTVQLGGNIRVTCATGFYSYISPGNFTNTNSIVMSCNVPIIYTGSRQSGNQFVRFNGSNTSSSNFTTNTFIPSAFNYYIGDDTYNDFFSGNLYEIVHYRYGLPLSDITHVEGYLAWKYGIQSNLISTHPYRYVPPY